MKTALWILGHVWLLIALVLVLGMTTARTSPTYYSFFGIGGWLSPGVYCAAVGGCLLVAAIQWISAMRKAE